MNPPPIIKPPPSVHAAVIPGWRPASDNELGKSVRAKISRKRFDRETLANWLNLIWQIPHAKGPRRVILHVTLGPTNHEPDGRNLWKSLLDGLVEIGQLVDDRNAPCKTLDPTFSRGRELHTTIILEDL
jgi:hypothetical protein